MALANLARCQQYLIQLLNANRLAYASTVGVGNAGIGAYKYTAEITDALLMADGLVVTEGYFQSEQSLRNRFLVNSTNIPNGSKLPEFIGVIGACEFSEDGINWNPSAEADSRQDVIGANALSGYVGAAMRGHHFIDELIVYHTSPFFRVSYPSYTKTTDLQSLDAHEPAVICGAAELLYKESSLHAADYYAKLRSELLERIRAGSLRMKSMMPKPLPANLRG